MGREKREVFFFQAEDGIRDLVRSRGLGDVYKRQSQYTGDPARTISPSRTRSFGVVFLKSHGFKVYSLSLIHI